MTRVAIALAAATIVWLAGPWAAWSHALLMESFPHPDEVVPPSFSRIVLRFNSRVEASLSRVSILDPSGGRLALRVSGDGDPERLIGHVPTLAPGTYTLEWRVLAAEGHVTRGSFPFRVAPAP